MPKKRAVGIGSGGFRLTGLARSWDRRRRRLRGKHLADGAQKGPGLDSHPSSATHGMPTSEFCQRADLRFDSDYVTNINHKKPRGEPLLGPGPAEFTTGGLLGCLKNT